MELDTKYCWIYGAYNVLLHIIVLCFAFPTFIIKWHFENPKRPLKIWWYDVSKTLLGYALLNIIPAYYFIADTEVFDVAKQYCLIHFMGTLMDGIFVTAFTYFLSMVFQNISLEVPKFKYITGYYPNGLRSWFGQVIIWLIVVSVSKFMTLGLIWLLYTPLFFINFFILYLVSWNNALQNIVIVFIAPLIQNIAVFYINVGHSYKI